MQESLTINCDNQGAIALSKSNKSHPCIKHINIHCHFIHKVIEDWNVSAVYIYTDENPIDILTKLLAKAKFYWFIEVLGLRQLGEKSKV